MYYSVPVIKDSSGGLRIAEDSSYYSVFILISDSEAFVQPKEGVAIPTDWTPVTQADWDNHFNPAPTLDQVKQTKLDELNKAYQAAFTAFTSNALGPTKTYPISQEAQDDLKDLQNRLIADPNKNSFYFLTMDDGILINHTRTQFLQLLQDAETRKVTIHNQNRTYANKISTTNDISTLQAMTFTFN